MFTKPTVLDGGVSTEIETDGHTITAVEFWGSSVMLKNPEIALPTHKRFVEAGADVIETNTYNLPICCLREKGLTEAEIDTLFYNCVNMATKAAKECSDRKIYIAGASGPYAMAVQKYVYDGSKPDYTCFKGGYVDDKDVVTEKMMEDYHYDQISRLMKCGCDVVALESVPALAEVPCILRALERVPQAKAWISFTAKSESELSHGEPFSQAASMCFEHPQIIAVGINCTNPLFVTPLLKSAEDAQKRSGKPFIVYPNSGEVYDFLKGWQGSAERGATWSSLIKEWHSHGVMGFGGCCRVYASDIRLIADAVNKIM